MQHPNNLPAKYDPARTKVEAQMPLMRQALESGSATIVAQRSVQDKNGKWILEIEIARPLNGKSKFNIYSGETEVHVRAAPRAGDLTLG